MLAACRAVCVACVQCLHHLNSFSKAFSKLKHTCINASNHCMTQLNKSVAEFTLKVFAQFAEFRDKKMRLFEPATSCVRDEDATTAPARKSALN